MKYFNIRYECLDICDNYSAKLKPDGENSFLNSNIQDSYENINKEDDWLISNGFVGKKWDSDTKEINAILSSPGWLHKWMSRWLF